MCEEKFSVFDQNFVQNKGLCEEKFSVFDQNFVQNKGPPKRNLGFKIRGQTEKNLRQAQVIEYDSEG